jgi:hypothetical protein
MPTVADLKKILDDMPTDATIRAYEGEGGAWLVIERGDKTILSINTDTGGVRYAY